ncbi:TPA: fimbria/pilus periplasmic chaperone [Salmonella enterica]|uniref:fimbria/pilus periplasmic chaperone n=1 Tax=Salmonella enterica TaxID=28901 RepID=UPI002974A0B7|nr:fimbria/pilus periplasmic chaperone [Salmonella enterica]
MKMLRAFTCYPAILAMLLSVPLAAHSAIAPDRTRIIYNGEEKSVTISLKNSNTSLPYLAQVWLENEKFAKETTFFIAQPPLQRIEANSSGQVKIQPLPGATHLPQDRETLLYFNVREIPPKSDKTNILQLAIQTRIKFFYRPAAVAKQVDKQHPWQEKLSLSFQGGETVIDNPTPFYVVISRAGNKPDTSAAGFKNMVLAPRSHQALGVKPGDLGSTPTLTYVDDYGGRRILVFTCAGNSCHPDEDKSRAANKNAS